MQINCLGKIRVLTPYRGGSKFPFWKDVCVGDVLIMKCDVKVYGQNLFIVNERTMETFEFTSNRQPHSYLNFWKTDDTKAITWENLND